mmetsp:Transcript_48721/g.114341  ORF Transcript_48721/g.114341 Transcript_48721/m.114341 type:complete len:170 (+) Transcript_48721:169-678(+)|eukprot:s76_g10.t1
MGCGASTAKDVEHPNMHPNMHRLMPFSSGARVVPDAVFDAIGPATGGLDNMDGDTRRRRPHRKDSFICPAKAAHDLRGGTSTASLPGLALGMDDDDGQREWSSWNSAHWKEEHPKFPMPPDRRMHERHIRTLNQFQKRIEKAPKALAKLVDDSRLPPRSKTPAAARKSQ